MEWRGKEIKTYGDIGSAISEIANNGTKADVLKFKDALRADNIANGGASDTADHNIGYIAGYYDRETARKIWELFDVNHPIFGRSIPDPEEALETGRQMAKPSN